MKKPNINYYKVSYAGRRRTNEDSAFIGIGKKNDNRQMVLAAADGMGGYQKGDVASKMMISHLKRLNQEILPPDPVLIANILRKHIKEANRSIFEKTEKTKNIQMGTTVSGAVVINNRCLFFNVGDSRTYLINPEDIKQVTRDHSADGEDLRNGVIKESEVGRGHYSHALTRSIGTDSDVDVDIFPPQGFYELEEGEMIFCCTDGLWRAVTKQDISREVFGRKNITQALEALAALAYSKGSDDNISIAALEYGTLERKKEKLKHFVPMSKFEKKAQGKKSKLLPVLLAFLTIVFLAIVVMLIIKLNSTQPTPVNDNQSQKESPIPGSHPVTDTVDNDRKPRVQEGKITFKSKGGNYRGGIQVQLEYENLKSSRGEKIPSEAYYTIDGSEPTKENGKKYIPGDKIEFNRSGEYTIKARLFSKVGKYEGKVHSQAYIIDKREPKITTIKSVSQLDEKSRNDIWNKTNKIMFEIRGISREDISGDMRMHLMISPFGRGEVIGISGINVIPGSKFRAFKKSLSNKINDINFHRPTSGRKSVRVVIWIDFKKIAVIGDKIILKR